MDYIFLSLRRKLRVRTAVVTHVVMIMNDATAKITGRSIREADTVFANSRYVAETVSSTFGIEAGTIHNGIDRRFFFRAKKRPSQPADSFVRRILSAAEASGSRHPAGSSDILMCGFDGRTWRNGVALAGPWRDNSVATILNSLAI
jgi:hypothetical protein